MSRPGWAPIASGFLLLALCACAAEPTAPAKVACDAIPLPPAPASPAGRPPAAEQHLSLARVDYADLPGWRDDRLDSAVAALKKSCDRVVELPPSQPIGRDGVGGIAGDWLGPCGALRDVDPANAAAVRDYVETWFAPFRAGVAGGKTTGLFTGYYEAELAGSLTPDKRFSVPLYAKPDDLIAKEAAPPQPDAADLPAWGRVDQSRFVPYWTRCEIEQDGALDGHAHPLLWVDDAVDAHILSIQGSGRVTLRDGTVVRVGFDGTNGRPFVGLTRILLDTGKLPPDRATMPDTRAWLEAHPADAPALMYRNPRYVFFRLIQGDGPIGAEGVALTPLRSMAVDTRFVPLGVPLWLDTKTPDGAPLRRLMVAQDTGAAIKGPVRGDVFWGAGSEAFANAGRMKSVGTLYLLLPRQRSGEMALADPGDRG